MQFFDEEIFFRSGTSEYYDKDNNQVLPNAFIDEETGYCSIDRQGDRCFDYVIEEFKSRFVKSKNHYGVAHFMFKEVKLIIDIKLSPSRKNKYHCLYESDLAKAVLISKTAKFCIY